MFPPAGQTPNRHRRMLTIDFFLEDVQPNQTANAPKHQVSANPTRQPSPPVPRKSVLAPPKQNHSPPRSSPSLMSQTFTPENAGPSTPPPVLGSGARPRGRGGIECSKCPFRTGFSPATGGQDGGRRRESSERGVAPRSSEEIVILKKDLRSG